MSSCSFSFELARYHYNHESDRKNTRDISPLHKHVGPWLTYARAVDRTGCRTFKVDDLVKPIGTLSPCIIREFNSWGLVVGWAGGGDRGAKPHDHPKAWMEPAGNNATSIQPTANNHNSHTNKLQSTTTVFTCVQSLRSRGRHQQATTELPEARRNLFSYIRLPIIWTQLGPRACIMCPYI